MVNIQDPTKATMKYFLRKTFKEVFDTEQELSDESEVAIYYFARDYHGGQSSNLYSAVSTSPYSPGCGDELGNQGIMDDMYTALVSKFADGYFGDCSVCNEPMDNLYTCQCGANQK